MQHTAMWCVNDLILDEEQQQNFTLPGTAQNHHKNVSLRIVASVQKLIICTLNACCRKQQASSSCQVTASSSWFRQLEWMRTDSASSQ